MRPRRPFVVFDADKHKRRNLWQVELNVPTELMRTFVAVHELGSFTKAAQQFDLTQPAVSSHMRKLETLLGGALIEKKSAGITLTARGERALKYARRMLALNDELVVACGARGRPQGIRLGLPNIAAAGLPKVIAASRREVGRIRISCDHSAALLQSVRSGYLDLALVFADKSELKDAVASWPEELVWVRSPDLVLERDAVVPLVASPNWLVPDLRAVEALDHARRPYEIVFSGFDGASRIAAVRAAFGCMALPRSRVPAALAVDDGGLPPLAPMTGGIVVREDLDRADLQPLIDALTVIFARAGAIDDDALRRAMP
jgi:DNA-binding transcriptional LysR family regulator